MSTLRGMLLLALVLALGFALSGCEVQSADTPVKISPDSVSLKKGQSATFTASGGFEYQWSLENDSWGTLSKRTGSQVTYKSLYSPVAADTGGSDAIQTLTVSSTITGGGGTNSTPENWTVTAYIHHTATVIPSSSTNSSDTPDPVGQPLKLNLTSASLGEGQSATFSASGGNPGYEWSTDPADTSSFGIFTASGSSATFTRTSESNGTVEVVVLTVTDDDNDSVSAHISLP